MATIDGIRIFHRESGDRDKPTILLLHGFPSSSHQFRDLIPLLSDNYHVVAPDYPGMGYSEAPTIDKFTPTFDNLTNVMTDFAQQDAIKALVPAAEVHDYDTGHFALEEDHVDIAKQINRFFAPAVARQVSQVRVRGEIEAVQGAVISVRTREGQHLQLVLDRRTRYSAVRPVDGDVIEPGTYIGAAGTPTADGVKALEVMVFREERRGTGEGRHDWDRVPGSGMTNATVSAVTPIAGGRDLELTYRGSSVKVRLADDVPIVTFAPADTSDLEAGVAIFAIATATADEKLLAATLVIEKNGVKPTM